MRQIHIYSVFLYSHTTVSIKKIVFTWRSTVYKYIHYTVCIFTDLLHSDKPDKPGSHFICKFLPCSYFKTYLLFSDSVSFNKASIKHDDYKDIT